MLNKVHLCFRCAPMELASSQGDHEAQTAQVQESDNTRGADGEKDIQPGSKQKVDVVNKQTSQTDKLDQTSQDIKTLAEAVKCLKENMKSLKRNHESQGEPPPPPPPLQKDMQTHRGRQHQPYRREREMTYRPCRFFQMERPNMK